MNPLLRLFKSLFKKINYDLIKNKPYDVAKNFPETSEYEKELFDICSIGKPNSPAILVAFSTVGGIRG